MDVRNHDYRSRMQLHAVFQSLAAWEVCYGVRAAWAGSREGGEYMTHSLLIKFVKQLGDDLAACQESMPAVAYNGIKFGVVFLQLSTPLSDPR